MQRKRSKNNLLTYKNPFRNAKNPYRFIDTDRDGVPDIYDCRPFDPKRHGVEPNIEQEKRLRKLKNVFVSDRPPSKLTAVYPLMSEEAKQKAPKARKIALATFKKYPELISKIEEKRPRNVIITSSYRKKGKSEEESLAWLGGQAVPRGRGRSNVYIYSHTVKGKPWKKAEEVSKYTEMTGESLSHELEHVTHLRRPKSEIKRILRRPYGEQSIEKQASRAGRKTIKAHKPELEPEALERRTLRKFKHMFSE